MNSNLSRSVLIIFSFLLLLILDSAAHIDLKLCQESCGEVEIPYPFGIGEGCFHENHYEIECKLVSGRYVPLFSFSKFEIEKISLPKFSNEGTWSPGSVLIKSTTTSRNEEECESLLNLTGIRNVQWFQVNQCLLLGFEWFFISKNISSITTLGCSNKLVEDESEPGSCICESRTESGIINATCACSKGYRGNPYILGGCTDIDECKEFRDGHGMSEHCGVSECVNIVGSFYCKPKSYIICLDIYGILAFIVGPCLLVLVGLVALYIFIRRRMRNKRRNKFFKRNGGLLLQQQITSTGSSFETTKIFTSKELAKATGNFSETRVLGQGGQGRVYKGMLIDGQIVAVKKSTVVDEDQIQDFINEVVLLSQLSHRYIVKLIGCCLETQVPLLVYEFISNGNLSDHIHNQLADETFSNWDVRSRIAVEIAQALCYMHSTASIPIYHRDIKTTNIMLDENYRAKLADFGTSRSVSEDLTHLTTVVLGTTGYVDPEYYQSRQYTEKSDVYSFGVVLVELITGEKPVCFMRSPENRMLATYFNRVMKENRLLEIIDARIKDESKVGQVVAVAQIAKRCLILKRRKRPVMRQVLAELELSRSSPEQLQPDVHESDSEEEEGAVQVYLGVEPRNNVTSTAPASQDNVAASSSSTSWPVMRQVLAELELSRSSPEQLQPDVNESDSEEEEGAVQVAASSSSTSWSGEP